MDPAAFPFRCELSLAPLITFWTQTSAYHEFGRGPIPGIVREKAREAPELAGVIDDLSLIEKHRAFVDLMMTAMFPPAFWEQEYRRGAARDEAGGGRGTTMLAGETASSSSGGSTRG